MVTISIDLLVFSKAVRTFLVDMLCEGEHFTSHQCCGWWSARGNRDSPFWRASDTWDNVVNNIAEVFIATTVQ